MTTYLYIDSKNRDKNNFPDATSFVVIPESTRDWPDEPRYVSMMVDSKKRVYDFFSIVSIKQALIIYDGEPTQPLIKLNFYNKLFNDGNLINTTDDNKEIKFILSYDKTLNANQVLYHCKNHQVMRIKRRGTFVIDMFDINNNQLNVGSQGRLVLHVEIKPYHLKYPYDIQAETLQSRNLIS
jgi:hypothetical protein